MGDKKGDPNVIEFDPIDEDTLRTNIVIATMKFKGVFGNIANAKNLREKDKMKGGFLKEEDINSFFTGSEGPWPVDCWGAANIIMAKGLIDTLPNNVRFSLPKDKTKIDPHFGYLNYWTHPPRVGPDGPLGMNLKFFTSKPEDLQKGDWGYIQNTPDYFEKWPYGDWVGENVIKVGDDRYFGVGSKVKIRDLQGWKQELILEYNRGIVIYNNDFGFGGNVKQMDSKGWSEELILDYNKRVVLYNNAVDEYNNDPENKNKPKKQKIFELIDPKNEDQTRLIDLVSQNNLFFDVHQINKEISNFRVPINPNPT
jgi:hypothetical protein